MEPENYKEEFKRSLRPYSQPQALTEGDIGWGPGVSEAVGVANELMKSQFPLLYPSEYQRFSELSPEARRVEAGRNALSLVTPLMAGVRGPTLKTRLKRMEVPEIVKGTKVADEVGNPIVVYHGTDQVFDQFEKTKDLGFHFGDKKAAQKRIKEVSKVYKKDPKDFHIDEYYLDIKNPLEIPDLKDWRELTLWPVLKGRGVIGKDENMYEAMDAIRTEVSKKVPLRWDEHFKEDTEKAVQLFANEWRKYLQNRIKQAGYDGIMYSNIYEGGTSYIAFDPKQIIKIPK